MININHPQMTVTWTSGYNIDEAVPLIKWGLKGETQVRSPAGTLTYDRSSMCGKYIYNIYFRMYLLIQL